ncbi:MAG: sugar transferase [Actinomycetota bacterium]|nr:sugar transferase [Actinomycetota bacterium]MCL6093389.1 sugar transferase [Actinomycetota bacterium]MDA8166730.1 sugar transferase [Actinomycetota bacterium]
MDQSPDPDTEGLPERLSGSWSFLPYEDGLEIPRRELQLLRAVHALIIPLTDILSLSLAVIAAYYISSSLVDSGSLGSILGNQMGQITSRMLWTGLATIPIWLLVFHYYGVYRREVRRLSVSTFDEMPQTIGALAVGAWLMFFFLTLTSRGNPTGRATWVFVFSAWLLLMFMLPLARAAVRVGLSFHNPFRTSTLVVGAGEVGRSLIGRLKRHHEYGLRVVGFLDTKELEATGGDNQLKLLGRPSELRSIVEHYGISRVIIAFTRTPHPLLLGVIHACQEMKVDVSIIPRLFEVLSHRVEIEDVEGLPILSLPRYTRHGRIARGSKRLMDLIGATAATIALSPILLMTIILIKLDSKGPVFYKQERMGKNHKSFKIFKFRSMHVDAESLREELSDLNETTGPIFKMKKDPRITRVGRIIRRLSIDELPQLINVFRGEMSLVGPRPLPVMEARKCLGTADMRHMVQPGITGLWQILGRSDIPYEEMVQLDYLYVTNWTPRWDFKIMVRTLIAIVRKRGAY